MDTYGVKVSALTSAALLFIAFGTMAATANGALPESTYFAAFCILGVGQIGQLHTLFSVSSLFPGYESLVVGVINGMADSAIVVFLVFNIAVLQGGVDFWVVIVVHIAGPVFMAACFAVFLWPWRPVEPLALREAAQPGGAHNATSGKASPTSGVELTTMTGAHAGSVQVSSSSEEEEESIENAAQAAPTPGASEASDAQVEVEVKDKAEQPKSVIGTAGEETADAESGASSAHAHAADTTEESLNMNTKKQTGSEVSASTGDDVVVQSEAAGFVERERELTAATDHAAAVESVQPVPVPFTPKFPYANADFKVQLASPLYVYLALFTVVNLFKFSFYLSSVDAHLNHLGQDGTTYTQIFSSLLPTGLVFVLVVGSMIDHLGLHVAVAANLAASILLSIVTLIPVLEVQVLGFILFALFRAHLFTVLTSILAAEFTFGSFGRLIGIASLVAALVGLLNSPLFDLAVDTFDGDFTVANVILFALTVLLQLPFAVFYWRYRTAADGGLFTEASVAAGFSLAIPKAPTPSKTILQTEAGPDTSAASEREGGGSIAAAPVAAAAAPAELGDGCAAEQEDAEAAATEV